MDIVNTPDDLRLYNDEANISLRMSILDKNAPKFLLEIFSGAQEYVPESRNCSL